VELVWYLIPTKNRGRRTREMRLPDYVIDAVENAKVHIYFADREFYRRWRATKGASDLTIYSGYYWHRVTRDGAIEIDEHGPFRSQMAAIKDAYIRLQLRPHRNEKKKYRQRESL
jgi:hypothetical protein